MRIPGRTSGGQRPSPRLSWVLTSDLRGEKQTAYQILAASSQDALAQDRGDLWDSRKTASDDTAQIAYAGSPLGSRQVCFWKVRVWDRAGNPSAWSPVASWRMGLLQPGDWTAQWIGAGLPPAQANQALVIRKATYEAQDGSGGKDVTDLVTRRVKDHRLAITVNNDTLGGDPNYNHVKRLRLEYEFGGKAETRLVPEGESLSIPPEPAGVPYLRKAFALAQPVKHAVLYCSALGLYEARLNGQRVGDQVLAPDWTDYRKRVQYQAYDVTRLLQQGDNTIGAQLANGWFCGHIGNGGYRFYGQRPAFLAQLEVTLADGRIERIVSDTSWRSHPGPILASDFMLGEDYDARLELAGWDRSGFNDSAWFAVSTPARPAIAFEAPVLEPVRVVRELAPKSVAEPKPGCWVYDLGQNLVGVARLTVTAPAGTKIQLRHAEMLNPDGTLYTRNLRGAPSIDHYICKGGGAETWQPRFTFHGFRYAEITGLPTNPGKDALRGIVIASDTPATGEFACSDDRINQLQANIQWGQRGNYVSVPTDCPQRDERLGWMGDAQVFIRTATYNADVAAFFTKWLVDVDDGQTAAGSFGDVNPNTMNCDSVPGWGDAGVICPWTIYDCYGDTRVLEHHLPAMMRWIEYLRTHSTGLIRDKDRGNDYGDWLSIGADTPKDLIGTAYFAYSTRLVARSCAALGRANDARKYEQLFQEIKTAFIQRFVAKDGRIKGNTQSAYAMALRFDLLPEELRAQAAQYLAADIQAKGGHLSTGFLGVSYLLPVLTQAGKANVACQLLLQDTFPSWLFSVKHGATTIWERWDGWTPDKGFQDPGMNSFNHYSLGSCGEYLFGYVGGIRAASPGYKTIRIDPVLCPGLTWAKTRYESIRGTVSTSWKREGNRLELDVVIPANTTATLCLPAKGPEAVTEGGAPAREAKALTFLKFEDGKACFEAGSGTYRFVTEL